MLILEQPTKEMVLTKKKTLKNSVNARLQQTFNVGR